jgi:hypothetical protein
MSQTVTISDQLYKRLETEARRRGLNSIEELLETWPLTAADQQQRQETVHEIRALRKRLFAKYGEAPDSTDLIHADRMR